MWFKTDSFHYVWKRVEGDVALAADIRFPQAGGNNHRKAVLMIRQTLDPDSVYADAVLHGDGLTSLQFREQAGDGTHEVQTAIAAPTRLRLEKIGDSVYLSLAGPDGVLRPSGCSTRLAFQSPFYLGLGVCAHDDEAFETVEFSKVVIGPPSTAVTAVRSSLEFVYAASADRRSVYHTTDRIEARGWAPDGSALLFARGDHVFRCPLAARGDGRDGAEPVRLTAPGDAVPERLGGNEVRSPDGKWVAILNTSPEPPGRPGNQKTTLQLRNVLTDETRVLLTLPGGLGTISPPAWSPDSTKIAYVRYQTAP